ncbi:hypothetical protein CRG98_010660 [Punica granatum]|uniref:Uncharacterized protein n=1 Tax=Punica granatum TaxID=22663 RepID=A0A2I0KK89_PUNGR|nr:hypothetical protein CRG98_010660 [Punica granatum]
MSFSYQTPPPLNIPPTEPGTPTHAAPAALPTNIPPENEQEKRMKRMEETIRTLQAGTSRPDFGDSDWNLFPGMLLPPKIKIPNIKRYDGTKDPRHHLRHCTDPNVDSRRGPHCALLDCVAWGCPPSRGDA